MAMIRPRSRQTAEAVAVHYDELDPYYREIWGRHVHHGLWTTGAETPEEATEALVERVAAALEVRPGQSLCDIGCGYGATAQHLASRHDVSVAGLTLSPVQAEHASALAAADSRLSFLCRDWLDNGLADQSFDGAYAIESSEHMEDKARFFREAFRVLRPGTRLAVCAWLARDDAGARETAWLLEPICREGRMPGMGTAAEYVSLAASAGFALLDHQDVSRQVSRTWTICAKRLAHRLVTDAPTRRFLLDGNARNRVFALTLLRLIVAYRTGAMRYGIFTFRRP